MNSYAFNNSQRYIDPSGYDVGDSSSQYYFGLYGWIRFFMDLANHDHKRIVIRRLVNHPRIRPQQPNWGGPLSESVRVYVDAGYLQIIPGFVGEGEDPNLLLQIALNELLSEELNTNTPCAHMGKAKSPSQYAAAGKAFKTTYIDPLSAINGDTADIAPGVVVGGLVTLYSYFHQGGSLDAQPYATGSPLQKASYGNYVYGVFFAAAGFSLNATLSAANIYGYKQQIVNGAYKLRTFGPDYGGIPIENVQDITAGYKAQLKGATCR